MEKAFPIGVALIGWLWGAWLTFCPDQARRFVAWWYSRWGWQARGNHWSQSRLAYEIAGLVTIALMTVLLAVIWLAPTAAR